MYLTYQEYIDYGGTLDETAFSRREYSVRRVVDQYTMKRVAAMAVVPENVKRLMFELMAQEEHDATVDATPQVASFNNDGYSETFVKPLTREEKDVQLLKTIKKYLWDVVDDNGTSLLYRGLSIWN
jgi:hypothetical protein